MIYLDSSALLKLLFEEDESVALAAWLTDRPDRLLVSSELAGVEVVRAARRLDPAVVGTARTLIAQLDLIPVTVTLLDAAAEVGDPQLRTIDAIHLASAVSIRAEITELVAYDLRLLAAAAAAGLPTADPR